MGAERCTMHNVCLQGLSDSAEILKARKVAVDGLIQLEDFAGLGAACAS